MAGLGWNIRRATMTVVLAAVTASCASAVSSSVRPGTGDSTPSPTTAADPSAAADPAGTAGAFDPALEDALQQGTPFAALVTVADADPVGGTTAAGVLPGPYATAKSFIVNSLPPGVRLLRDYDQFALLEVEIDDRAGLTDLLTIPGVAKVSAQQHFTTAGTS